MHHPESVSAVMLQSCATLTRFWRWVEWVSSQFDVCLIRYGTWCLWLFRCGSLSSLGPCNQLVVLPRASQRRPRTIFYTPDTHEEESLADYSWILPDTTGGVLSYMIPWSCVLVGSSIDISSLRDNTYSSYAEVVFGKHIMIIWEG